MFSENKMSMRERERERIMSYCENCYTERSGLVGSYNRI